MRVIAHVMHDQEREEAEKLLSINQPVQVAPAFVIGVADKSQIEELEKKGIIVQPVDAIDREGRSLSTDIPETPGRGAMPLPDLRRPITYSTSTFEISGALESALPDPSKEQTYLVQIPGPLLPDYKERLSDAGARLIESFCNGFYSTVLTRKQALVVEKLPFVVKLSYYDAGQTFVRKGTLESLGEQPAKASHVRMLTYDLRLHREEDVGDVLAWLREHRIAIAGHARRKIRIYVEENSNVIAEVARLKGVKASEEFVPPKLFNDRACLIMKLQSSSRSTFAYDGKGQIVGIADTGLDSNHADFKGRVLASIPLGRPALADDPDGHGTHVAGSAVGDGAASKGALRGTAPGASLVFQSLLDNRGELGGLPLDLGDLFEEAYNLGAKIHNNSWGAGTASTYTANAEEVDEFVAAKRDMLVVIAAGNEGDGAHCKNARSGYVDWLSIGSPATAKNALSVGASRSDRKTGGYSKQTWGTAWGANYPFPPLSTETISGNPEEMAGFSSRGPSDDRRIKPDVVAPGTDIVSCRSSNAPSKNFWGSYTGNPAYAYMGGTSMATPLVSGCAALIRQYFEEARKYSEPSAALVRATLINGTRWLTGAHAVESHLPGPANFDQGFGCVDMSTTIPAPKNAGFVLAYEDNWQTPSRHLISSGDARLWQIDVASSKVPLRVCLVFTDVPGRALQNNLNLFVQSPEAKKYIGNDQLRHSLNIPDVDNNCEVVRIKEPKPGTYLIQISAQNILHGPQDFALVVTGDLRSSKLTDR